LITVLINKIYIYDDGRLTILFYNGDTTTEIDIGSIDIIEKDIPAEMNNRCYFLGDTSSAT